MISSVQGLAFYTIARKEILRVFRIWKQTLLPSVITTSLYFLIFGKFIGSRVGDMMNHSYIEFIIPGLVMMGVISNSYSNVSSSFFGEKFLKSIEEILIAPVSNMVVIFGFVIGGVVRGSIVGFLIILVSGFFSDLAISNIGLAVVMIFLTAGLFSMFGLINAIYAKRFDDVSIVPTFVLNPLTYLGGVFYSIKLLPVFWQRVSLFNPILYIVNIFRYAFLGYSDIPVLRAFIVLVFFLVVVFFFCLHLLKRGVGLKN
jgi:ABC-2 type transport system permease protein